MGHKKSRLSAKLVPEETITEQRAAYTALLQSLGEMSFEQIQKTLDERETISPEDGLSSGVFDRIK